MKEYFTQISEIIFNEKKQDENIIVTCCGEESQFIRFNGPKVRQTGLVDDFTLYIKLISNNSQTESSFTCCGKLEIDQHAAIDALNKLRVEVEELPDDPFIVMPGNIESSTKQFSGNLLSQKDAVNSLIGAFSKVDLSGIYASGKMYAGNANSMGQTHWFETDSFSFDYSLITPDEKMVKSTYAGTNWNQVEYESNMHDSIAKLKSMNQSTKKIKPGQYKTYIASAGVSDILDMFSWGGISEAAIQQGDSALGKMANDNVKLSPCFNLHEDFSSGIVPRFNDNGEVAVEKLPLIIGGTLKNTLVSTRTSKEYNKKSNFASDGEHLRSPMLESGGLSEDEILDTLGTGVYLSNLHYLNWSDRIGGRITGMTRYACFWVENGQIISPIENMRFDDTIYNIFGKNLIDLTAKSNLNPNVMSYNRRSPGGTYCPGILLDSFNLTL